MSEEQEEVAARGPEETDSRPSGGEPEAAGSEGELLGRVEIIEEQPLAQRAAGFEQLHDELLVELQRSDGEGPASDSASRQRD